MYAILAIRFKRFSLTFRHEIIRYNSESKAVEYLNASPRRFPAFALVWIRHGFPDQKKRPAVLEISRCPLRRFSRLRYS
jgi:hypothetical protein